MISLESSPKPRGHLPRPRALRHAPSTSEAADKIRGGRRSELGAESLGCSNSRGTLAPQQARVAIKYNTGWPVCGYEKHQAQNTSGSGPLLGRWIPGSVRLRCVASCGAEIDDDNATHRPVLGRVSCEAPAMLLGCCPRRSDAAALAMGHVERRGGRRCGVVIAAGGTHPIRARAVAATTDTTVKPSLRFGGWLHRYLSFCCGLPLDLGGGRRNARTRASSRAVAPIAGRPAGSYWRSWRRTTRGGRGSVRLPRDSGVGLRAHHEMGLDGMATCQSEASQNGTSWAFRFTSTGRAWHGNLKPTSQLVNYHQTGSEASMGLR